MDVARIVFASATVSLLLAGCGGPSAQPVPGSSKNETTVAVPAVQRCGDLSDFFSPTESRTSWTTILSGAEPAERLVPRNPQGMAVVGDRLLICDQGWSDVLAVHLGSGETTPWCQSDQRPQCPVTIAVGPQDRVYVTDATRHCVLVYDLGGRYLERISPSNSTGFRPGGLLVDGGILYIGDLGGRCLARYDLSRREWDLPMSPPEGKRALVAPTGLCRGPGDTLLVVDAIQGVIHRVTTSGIWMEPFGHRGRGPAQFVRPKQVCWIEPGTILVTDAGRQSVLAFDEAGRPKSELREKPGEWSGWTLPMGVVVIPAPAAEKLLMTEKKRGAPGTGSPVIVSDSLGSPALTLLAVQSGSRGNR